MFPSPIYGRIEKKYRVRENSFFVRFTNSGSVPPAEDRIRMGSARMLVAIETQKYGKSRERLIVSRKEELDDLIAAFDRQLREEHPNPERANCPGRAALKSLASEPEAFRTEAILDHIRECAVCLDELKELRKSRNADL